MIGVIPTHSTKLITDSSGTISSFTVHQKCFTKFVTSLKENHTRSKKVKENHTRYKEVKTNTKDVVNGGTNEPKVNTKDGEKMNLKQILETGKQMKPMQILKTGKQMKILLL